MSQATEFEALVRACHGELFAVVLARRSDRESAKDLVQEVLLAAWRNRDRLLGLPGEERRRYLFTMARNRAIDAARQAARQPATRNLGDEFDPPTAPASPSDDRLDMLDHCMHRLASDDRELLMLSTVGELDSQAIADRVGSIPATVRSRLSRIRRQLRECIGNHMERANRVG